MKEKIRFTLRLPKEIFEKLKEESQKKGITMNGLITLILAEYFEGREN